jgi:hypothetical protein
VSSRPVGDGFVVRAVSGTLVVLSGWSALLWRRLTRAPASFVELVEVLSDAAGLDGEEADAAAETTVRVLHDRRLLQGPGSLRRMAAPRRHRASDRDDAGCGWDEASGVRVLGALDPMCAGAALPGSAPLPGTGPSVRDVTGPVTHVAIVCQYGIRGLAPGVDAYARRCIAALDSLAPDLVVVSGGGRHGLAAAREAESVIARYGAQVSRPAVWLEKYSTTTWENLQHSLEMLRARDVRPRRVSVLGDRARAEKLRICCWLARRRFPAFRDVRFEIVPVARARSTWRDTRAIQLIAGCAQVLSESRRAAPAIPMDAA